MKLFLFLLVFILLILFIYNKKEYFTNKIIIGDVSYEDYSIDENTLSKLISDNLLKPSKIKYSFGKSGVGIIENISTINFNPKNIKNIIPEAVDVYGEQEIVNLEALVPFLLQIIKKHNTQIKNNTDNFNKFEKDLSELKK